MNLQEMIAKIKGKPDIRPDVFILATIIMLVLIFYFAVGVMIQDASRAKELRLSRTPESQASTSVINLTDAISNGEMHGLYVGSIQGEVYHLPWCQGAKKIKDSNKIWFQSEEEAQKAGYRAAGNCDGL